jgi:hypothetical protein
MREVEGRKENRGDARRRHPGSTSGEFSYYLSSSDRARVTVRDVGETTPVATVAPSFYLIVLPDSASWLTPVTRTWSIRSNIAQKAGKTQIPKRVHSGS